jgi:hypothetical protein
MALNASEVYFDLPMQRLAFLHFAGCGQFLHTLNGDFGLLFVTFFA